MAGNSISAKINRRRSLGTHVSAREHVFRIGADVDDAVTLDGGAQSAKRLAQVATEMANRDHLVA